MKNSNMYKDAKTWSPFKGCRFDCTYCEPTFKRQAKRQKRHCNLCYKFKPHTHPDRLDTIPNAPIIFVCGNGDLAHCHPDYRLEIVDAIRTRSAKRPNQVFYLQSKMPKCFNGLLQHLPSSVILVTTLETNRDKGYSEISKAPVPSERFRQFLALNYPRKIVTIEPIMDFDLDVFARWIISIAPEYVWLGFNSRPKSAPLPEPSEEKVVALIRLLKEAGIEVRGKSLREIDPEACASCYRHASQRGSRNSQEEGFGKPMLNHLLFTTRVMTLSLKA